MDVPFKIRGKKKVENLFKGNFSELERDLTPVVARSQSSSKERMKWEFNYRF
jgi:hypothetical protein